MRDAGLAWRPAPAPSPMTVLAIRSADCSSEQVAARARTRHGRLDPALGQKPSRALTRDLDLRAGGEQATPAPWHASALPEFVGAARRSGWPSPRRRRLSAGSGASAPATVGTVDAVQRQFPALRRLDRRRQGRNTRRFGDGAQGSDVLDRLVGRAHPRRGRWNRGSSHRRHRCPSAPTRRMAGRQ